jgi:phosphoglycolate phosphatase-like HAD superfamily hydrolase/ADP-ribose pyrophosphatase YjhB (NUDIX family)
VRYSGRVIRNIIFDWSGTLVDDLPAVWEATNAVFRQAGLKELTLEQFRAEFCLPFVGFYERHAPHLPLAQLEDWFHAAFLQAQDSVMELPHAREFLRFCRARGLRTFVLSTVRHDHFERQARALEFAAFIDRPYLAVHDKRAKIHELLAENQLAPAETLFIGDMQHDIDTARHGGILSCAVLTGYNSLSQLRASQPDLIVEHLGELRELLDRNGLTLQPATPEAAAQAAAHPVATVGALIFDARGQVLMIRTQKWSNLWGIPGGKIKFGESAPEALRRELREETNLEIQDIQFVLVQDCIHSKEFYRDAHFVLLNYTCRCVGEPDVRLNEEAIEFHWVTPEQAWTMDLNQPTRILLEALLHSHPHGPNPH